MKRFLLLGILLFSLEIPTVQALSLTAQSAILMEAESGRVLYAKNEREESLIASITKLLTALVVVESEVALHEKITIAEESCGVEGSSLYLKAGDQLTIEALLYGMLLHSGNDAAMALALHCGGSAEHFVALMNQKARDLGMEQSSFANPHGLNQDGHYSTAYDMALVAQACLEHSALAEMVATRTVSVDGRNFTNKNKLLWYYQGCIGMKTGYTQQAGRTLVSAATRDGMTLICVTLDAPDDWNDHQNLFDYGFSHYTMTPLLEDTTVGQLPLVGSLLPFASIGVAEQGRYPLGEGESLDLAVEFTQDLLETPLQVGNTVSGLGVWTLAGEPVHTQPLIVLEEYPDLRWKSPSFKERLEEFFLRS